MSIALYPGTFDPVTNGHLDVLSRATRLFERVIVAVSGTSSSKQTVFDAETRVSLVRENISGNDRVSVEAFDGLLVDYAKERGASVLVRGLRAVSDFEYEFQMAGMNSRLNRDVETVFLMASERQQFIASKFVKEIGMLGGDVGHFVSSAVRDRMLAKIAEVNAAKS